jgi:hypothetical protein
MSDGGTRWFAATIFAPWQPAAATGLARRDSGKTAMGDGWIGEIQIAAMRSSRR